MKTRLLLLFVLLPAFVFSQTKISGKVVDKETQKPVSDVIIHSSGKISITNGKGEYGFEISHSEKVYFRHLSYKSFKIQSDSLQDNGIVYLTSNVTELNEVVISPNRAKSLLKKAVNNLFVNFQKEKTKLYYLTHIGGITTNGCERDASILFEATLNKKNVKNNSMKWELNLMKIDRITGMNKKDFAIKNIINSAQFFPSHFLFPTFKDDKYLYDIYEDNNEELVVRMSPQYPNKKHYLYNLYTIEKRDTVLTKIITQSYSNSDELTAQKFRKTKIQTSNHFYVIEFIKSTSGIYSLDKVQHLVNTKITSDTVVYNITNTILTYYVEYAMTNAKNKKIKSHDYDLCDIKFIDTPGFWKKYENH